MPLENPHDKQDLVRKMRAVKSALMQHPPGIYGDERRRILGFTDDIFAYLEDDRVHYGCPMDDPCGFGEDEPDGIKAGDEVELIHDVWSLLKGQRFRATIYSCSNGRWYCESIGGRSIDGWIDGDDLKVVEVDAVPSPPQ